MIKKLVSKLIRKRKKVVFVAVAVMIALMATMFPIHINLTSDFGNQALTLGQGSYTITIGNLVYAGVDTDYTCDGIDDDITFQTALDALPAIGGQILVLAGTYNWQALTTVTRAIDNVSIIGVGASAFFDGDAVTAIFTAGGNKWLFSNFRTDAGGLAMGATSDWMWLNIFIGATFYSVEAPDDPLGAAGVDTSGTPVANDYARFTDEDTIEGRDYTEVKLDLALNLVENATHSTDTHTMTIDGRDVSADGTKLDAIEAGATKYPDTGEQAFLDADHTKLDAIEAGATKYPDTGEQAFLDADHTKLDAIEALADVTDAANVATAGALMDSGTDIITNLHIDWGAGAGQVDADDVPDSATKFWAGETGADVTDATNVAAAGALMVADLENPPTEDDATTAPTSEWAFDHAADIEAHYDMTGSTFPVTPVDGMIFCHEVTGRKILYCYDLDTTEWIPIINIGSMTVYVSTTGTDDLAHGTATGSDAFLTVQYAVDVIPGLVGGDVTIHIGLGTFADTITVQGKSFTGAYGIYIYGAAFDDTALTIDSATQGTNGGVVYGTITDNGEGWGLRSTLESGNTDGIGASTFVLKDTGQNFLTTCRVGMRVKNTSDDTWAYITNGVGGGVDSDTQLTLGTDIMDDGENYIIGWAEHKGTWITFNDATATEVLQGDRYLILENDSDTLTIVGKFDAVPAGGDTAYISTLQTIITGKITVVTGQLGVNFYRVDLDGESYQIDIQPLSEANWYYCDINTVGLGGIATFTRCFIHKEDDIQTSNRIIFASSKFVEAGLTSCLLDGEGLHYSTSSPVRGIDMNNGATVHLRIPPSVVQNFIAKSGVTNIGIYMRINAYTSMWVGSDCRNWIRFCTIGLDAALGSMGQYCLAPYVTYEDNFDDLNVDAATFAVVT